MHGSYFISWKYFLCFLAAVQGVKQNSVELLIFSRKIKPFDQFFIVDRPKSQLEMQF